MVDAIIWWTSNAGRNLPRRAGRLAGVLIARPPLGNAGWMVSWLHSLLWGLFDLAAGPETFEFFLRSVTHARPLTADERTTAESIFGPKGIQYRQVRVAEGGLLEYVFRRNGNRAFATWHTINLPDNYADNLPLLIHEMTHVFQYERVGSVYIGQGLWAQRRLGRAAYDYQGEPGLKAAHAAGIRFRHYNREQQGQIVQDYCARMRAGLKTSAYDPFIDEMRDGLI
jgi:hypothetical protein